VRKWLKKVSPFVGTAVVAVIAAAALVFITRQSDDPSPSPNSYETVLPPDEFLYLNGAKILTYLSELEGGETGSIHRLAKEVRVLTGTVGTKGASIGATSQHETSAQSTLVRTEAAELGLLLRDLHEDTKHGVAYAHVSLDEPGSLAELKEGELVRFVTRWLSSPGYIRPYVVVHGTATFGALFPRTNGGQASIERATEQGELAKAFAHQVGGNPRVTFMVDPPEEAGNVPKIMLPLNYGGLTTERSLLEKDRAGYTGGRVVVFGKVARVFPEGHARCSEGPACAVYTDFATREVWKHPLEQASNYLVEHVSHNCRSRAAKKETGRKCFLTELENETELPSPGAVIVPIAILK
jgi:hypothetical protein